MQEVPFALFLSGKFLWERVKVYVKYRITESVKTPEAFLHILSSRSDGLNMSVTMLGG